LAGKAYQDKHSSLLRALRNYGCKTFDNNGPWTKLEQRFI
jgi:hypothetical protein